MSTIWQTVTWDVARAGGFTAYVLLTLAVAVGLALSTQLQSPSRWPRLLNSELHNFLTLLSTIFLVVHVLAVWVDPFTKFGWKEIFIPLASHYRPEWMALGIVGLYLGIAITHWLHLVETAACADTGHLCARDSAWDWDRQRYTDLVGTGHLPRKPCPGRLAPLPKSALFERQTQARSRASCHSSSQRGRCSAEQPSGAERWEGCSNAYDVTESGRRCSCHEPPHTCRGLVASLCLNSKGDPSALASMTATSPWERTPKIYGTMTRYQSLPTVAEPLASKERYQSTKNVLPEHGILAQNPSVQLERYRVGELSLSPEGECLSLQAKTCKMLFRRGGGLFLPALKRRGFLARSL